MEEEELIKLLRWAYDRTDSRRLYIRKYLDVDEAAGSTYEEIEHPESIKIRELLKYKVPFR